MSPETAMVFRFDRIVPVGAFRHNMRALILVALLLGGTLLRADAYLGYMVNGTATGFFGGVDVSGWYSADLANSSMTVTGASDSAYQYTYTFSGPLNGPGYTETSQIPPTPCIIFGCTPSGPGTAGLHVSSVNTVLADLNFEDTGEDFIGTGSLTYGWILPGLEGGSSSAPASLPSPGPVSGITDTFSAETSEIYYDFLWRGGFFSATGTVDGASSGSSYVFSTGVSGTCTSGGTSTLNSADSFTGTISVNNLPAGQYCIGIDANTATDPSFFLTFNTPVNPAAAVAQLPEPSGFVLLSIGLLLTGWRFLAQRRQRPSSLL